MDDHGQTLMRPVAKTTQCGTVHVACTPAVAVAGSWAYATRSEFEA